ncbi:MAG: alpha-amylase, partial [Merismopedia sp. SIO2A8]|nr:alpha-amylase [Merismopedia sp. SIO2A8]
SYSSDDGFAVMDYLAVNSELGDWEDIGAIAQQFDLMVDLVINHVSSEHAWFQQFKAGEKPGCDYFVTADPNTDLSHVVRPRSSPLLAPTETVNGTKYVWATFSHDQVDVDFSNPDVLLEYVAIILFYVQAGAKYIRLDAIGYLWKKLDTACIHLPETHAVIRVLRELLQMIDPEISLITETNVPNRENLSYFGNRNEAHMIYNFSLPPLMLNALLQGKSEHLKTWMMSMPPAPLGCAYFNFTASHDGIGLRPAEGLLTDEEYTQLLDTVQRFGGEISMRQRSDGSESPYEMNISLFDALKGTVRGEDQWQVERFICSQTIMMSVEGIPAFYIHSLLATHNDYEGVKRTGRKRSINRHSWDYEQLMAHLENPQSDHARVFNELRHLIDIRQKQGAFHPNATQYTLHPLNPAIFAFWRQSMTRNQSIFSIHNLSDQVQELSLKELNLIVTDPWCDLISGIVVSDLQSKFVLKPYQSAWLTNKY